MTTQIHPDQEEAANNKLTLLFLSKVLVAYFLTAYLFTFACILKTVVADGVNIEELRSQIPGLLWVPLWFPLLIYQITLNAVYESKYFWKSIGWFFVMVCSIYTGWKISEILTGLIHNIICKINQQR